MAAPRKVSLIQLPTPLHRLDRLSAELGIDLWIKRDDLSGFGGGGNKGRKLEYLLADAIDKGAEVIVTCGTTQSNFVRQLGAACAVFKIGCAAATMALPYEDAPPTAPALEPVGGNVFLDELLGVDLRVYPDGDWDALYAHAENLAKEYEAKGKRVYRVPIGGSSRLSAYGLYKAGEEIRQQSPQPFDWIVFGSSSGSTHTGLTYAFHGSNTRILGISSDPEPEILEEFAAMGVGLAEILGVPPLTAADFSMDFDYVGPGYAAPSEAGNEAILRLARTEGIFLDPVYSGKAFAGLLDRAAKGTITGRVLFWHTGGLPSLFAMRSLKVRAAALVESA